MMTQWGCEESSRISLPALMKILVGIIIMRRVSMVGGVTAISLQSIDLCRVGIGFNSIALEEWLKANEVFAKEINIV